MTTSETVVEKKIHISATAEEIFPFLLEVDKLALWLAHDVEAEARPGGRLRAWGSTGDVLSCEYLEIERPRRLLMTWGWEKGGVTDLPPGSSRVELTLEPDGGGTVVRVRHFDLGPAHAESHEQGWAPALRYLREAAEGRPGDRRCVGDPSHGCSGG